MTGFEINNNNIVNFLNSSELPYSAEALKDFKKVSFSFHLNFNENDKIPYFRDLYNRRFIFSDPSVNRIKGLDSLVVELTNSPDEAQVTFITIKTPETDYTLWFILNEKAISLIGILLNSALSEIPRETIYSFSLDFSQMKTLIQKSNIKFSFNFKKTLKRLNYPLEINFSTEKNQGLYFRRLYEGRLKQIRLSNSQNKEIQQLVFNLRSYPSYNQIGVYKIPNTRRRRSNDSILFFSHDNNNIQLIGYLK